MLLNSLTLYFGPSKTYLSLKKINASERQVMPNVGRHGIEEKLISEFPLS